MFSPEGLKKYRRLHHKMNKFVKTIVAILGAVNMVFSIFIPIAISLTIISFFQLNQFNITLVMITGILATIYRTIKIFIK